MYFEFSTCELTDALIKLEPFVYDRYKDSEEYDGDITSGFLYPYDDKVTFEITDGIATAFVYACGIKYRMPIKVTTGIRDASFCIRFCDLLDEVQRLKYERLVFEEILFYGFSVYDKASGDKLFKIRAYSTAWQEETSKEAFTVSITFDKNYLIETLKQHYPYSEDNGAESYGQNDYIWLYIKDKVCNVLSTNDRFHLFTKSSVNIEGEHLLTIPSGFVRKGINILEGINDDIIQLNYNKEFIQFLFGPTEVILKQKRDNNTKFGEVIQRIFSFQGQDTFKVVLLKSSFTAALRRAASIYASSNDCVQLDFMPEQLKVSYKDVDHKCGMTEIISADCNDKFTIKAFVMGLLAVLNDITSHSVKLLYPKGPFLFIFAENEDFESNVLRFVSLRVIDNEYEKLYI